MWILYPVGIGIKNVFFLGGRKTGVSAKKPSK